MSATDELRQATYHLNNAAEAHLAASEHDAAIACLEAACHADRDNAQAANNLAFAYRQIGRYQEALEEVRRGLSLNPNLAQLHHNHGQILTSLGDEQAAIGAYQIAVGLDPTRPESHLNLGLLYARFQNRYYEFLREYEWRFAAHEKLGNFRKRFPVPDWQGESLEGKRILVYCEQGMGDLIHFARYLPALKNKTGAAKVLVEAPFELVNLLEGQVGIDEVVLRNMDNPGLPAHDCVVSILSLPYRLFGHDHLIPYLATEPYLRLDVSDPKRGVDKQRPQMKLTEPGLKVGLTWAGSDTHPTDQDRSMPLELLHPLADLSDIAFYSIQKGNLHRTWRGQEVDLGAGRFFPVPLWHTEGHLCDFYATACLLEEIDLLITVDTAIGHLAGALHRPVFMMLAYQHDWRWPVRGDATPWYPTMRLFRQSSARDWREVVTNVKIALEVFAVQHKRESTHGARPRKSESPQVNPDIDHRQQPG